MINIKKKTIMGEKKILIKIFNVDYIIKEENGELIVHNNQFKPIGSIVGVDFPKTEHECLMFRKILMDWLTDITYPSVVEVSSTINFKNDPNMKPNQLLVCIGKIDGKFMCLLPRYETDPHFVLDYFKGGVKSGGISGYILDFWRYARKV